ncbi:ABC transporter transmembrane domain-containing protein [Marinibacterium sp. SX1]|uniref:ABC transporter transmembrane domain-containing protein n=1 Tax=Marinibacterium sp. SX1 TaxID=3388424 RepID=UPI003D186BC3
MWDMYAAIWRVSGRRQVILILLSVAIAALAAVPLSYQKDIINELTDDQISQQVLIRLCAEMLGVIVLSLGLKWALGFLSNLLGEDVIRRLRRRIYGDAVGGGPAHELGAGTVTTMVSAEAEELGKFAGSAFSEPVVQIGTMVSVVGYIATAQPVLGLIALMIVAPQVILVLTTQRVVNRFVAERVRVLRRATRDIVDTDLARESAEVLRGFDEIYDTRRQMFLWKLSTKFVLSLINGAGTVGVLLLGGWAVLNGTTDVGTVVAATMGLARLQGPTSFMIAFYRLISATRVKFELLRDVALPRPDKETATSRGA